MSSPLATAAGPIALVSGLVFAAVDVARLLAADSSLDRIEMMRQTPFQVTNALYWVVFVGLILALVSVYFRHRRPAPADWAPSASASRWWAPWTWPATCGSTASPAPGLPTSPPAPSSPAGPECWRSAALSSYVLFALGWMVFGIAGWRARMFPAWIGIAFVVAGFLGYNAGLPPYGIPIGLVMAALGWWIIRTGAPAAAASDPATDGRTARRPLPRLSPPGPSPTARPAARVSARRWRRRT